MELLHEYGSPRRGRFVSSSTSDLRKTAPVSKLIILQARFQQKQLQEKEEKLLRLYEEQQERAMSRVGGRGLPSSTASVGRGKVRDAFQSRRGTGVESRQGRDRSYPLEPIAKSPWSRDEDSRGVRRTQSQVRAEKPKSRLLYFGGSHTDLRFSDELDYVQTFHVIDDHYEIADDTRNGLTRSGSMSQRRPEYKTYVAAQRASAEKPHLGKATREAAVVAPPPPRQGNAATKPRKPTPMPATVAPKPHLLQTKRKPEVTPPVPASRTTVTRSSPAEKPPAGRKPPSRTTLPPRGNDLPECQFCGRHFAEDRIAKHEDICKKSSRTKRKPFDSVKQRIKGTEAEQFLKGGKLRNQQQQQQPQKQQVKPPQRDWRKTHEDFISSIRAAREYQIASSQVKKPSMTRPSTGSRY